MLKKTLLAAAMGVVVAPSLQAATWSDRTPAGPIEISGTVSAVQLPGKWMWAVGGKTDFNYDIATTPMTNGNKTLKITVTDVVPILAGRIDQPILGGSGSNVYVTYPNVVVASGSKLGYELDPVKDQGIILRAPVSIVGKTGVQGVATLNATGAGTSYSVLVDLPAGTPYTSRAIAPLTNNQLCAGLVGRINNDGVDAFNAAKVWLSELDSTLSPSESTMTADFLTAAKLIDNTIQTGPTATQPVNKLAGLHSRVSDLVSAQCGVGMAKSAELQIDFDSRIVGALDWIATLSPTVTYN